MSDISWSRWAALRRSGSVRYLGLVRNVSRIGWVLIGIGLLVGLVPFLSVWRTSGLALGQLPDITATEISDQQRWAGAVFDDDYVLATRTYSGVTVESVQAALIEGGFEPMAAGRFTKPCCGESDAVWVTVNGVRDESVVAIVTVADSDWRAAWKVFAVVSLLMVVAGLGNVLRGDKRPDRVPELI